MRHHLKRYNYAAHGAYCNCSPNAGGIASDIAGAYSANRRDHTGEHRRIFDQYGKYSEYWNRGLNMLNQFSRTQLLIGQKGMERLFNARVAVFGIGGVGGYTVEALARSGIGTLDLIDDDRVCLTNLNRQLLATRKTVGQYKVDVAEQRIHEINPDAVVHTYKTFYTPQTTEQFDFTRYDYVVDAIDTVTGKLELAEQAPKNRNAYRQQYGRREQDGCCRL